MKNQNQFRRKLGFAAFSLLFLTVLYFFGFMWLEFDSNHKASGFALLGQTLPLAAVIIFISFLLRYARWHGLINKAGYSVRISEGLLAYLAGFAFTASPGKAGELVRCRYFSAFGVPVRTTFAAFLYERSMDLLVVLALSALALWASSLFIPAAAFVLLVLGILIAIARWGHWIEKRGILGQESIILSASRFIRGGVDDCRVWLNPSDLLVSAAMGIMAWSLVCAAFIWVLSFLGIMLPLSLSFSLYPMAMLAGAASMIPGGIGTTEAAIVLLLSSAGVSIEQAALAALGIRVATLWFAMVCGLVSVFILELRNGKTTTSI
ncbi:conserved hypothetical protein [marine gamma proteobacterium HTCC2148]|nr:conserved hypothetical protein [marine gamma proteobacterium HTCC2148]